MYRFRPSHGADPEFFLLDERGRPYPASKSIPHDRDSSEEIVYDNAAAEIRTLPATCLEELADDVAYQIKWVCGRPGVVDISVEPTAEFSDEVIAQHPELNSFGCDPSMVLMPDGIHESCPRPPDGVNVRSAGYHVHIGSTRPEQLTSRHSPKYKKSVSTLHETEKQLDVIELLDLFLGVPGVIFEREHSRAARQRRTVLGYGRAGEFRTPAYGLEYRTLGPWPIFDPIWVWWVGSVARCCVMLASNDLDEDLRTIVDRETVCDAINRSDVDLAVDVWNRVRTRLLRKIPYCTNVYGSNDALFTRRNIMKAEFAMGYDAYHTYCKSDSVAHNHSRSGANYWWSYVESVLTPDRSDHVGHEHYDEHTASKFDKFSRNWSNTRDNVGELIAKVA